MANPDIELIKKLQSKFKKNYGSSAVTALGEKSHTEVMSGISSSSLCLDMAIGRPGIPVGRITEISGLESVGKSLIGLHCLAEVQRIGGIGILLDAESGLDLTFAKNIGLEPGPSIFVIQPDDPTLEDAFEMIEVTVQEIRDIHPDVPLLVLFDSIAGVPCRVELEGNYDSKDMAPHARVLSKGMRKLTGVCTKYHVALVLINQLRDKIGGYSRSGPDSFGGRAIRFHLSLRLRIKRTDMVKTDDGIIGIKTKVQVIKNKLAAPYKSCELVFHFEKGLDKAGDLLEAAKHIGVVKSEGAWYKLDGRDSKFARKQWRGILANELGGWEKYKDFLEKEAIKCGLLLPYGQFSDS